MGMGDEFRQFLKVRSQEEPTVSGVLWALGKACAAVHQQVRIKLQSLQDNSVFHPSEIASEDAIDWWCNTSVSIRKEVARSNGDYTGLRCAAPHCTALLCSALHYTALHCTLLLCSAPLCTALHSSALLCSSLACTVLESLLYPVVP